MQDSKYSMEDESPQKSVFLEVYENLENESQK